MLETTTPISIQTQTSRKTRLTLEEAAARNQQRELTLRKLAGTRVSAAVKKIRLIGNLSAYRPTTGQAEHIVKVLSEAVLSCQSRLQSHDKRDVEFTLPK